jgi:hypothetical protein
MMPPDPQTSILAAFPHTRYHSHWRTLTWHPRGVLDGVLADQVMAFVESTEAIVDVPFHRFTDFTGLVEIRLKVDHVFQLRERRRQGYAGQPVKSAFFSDRVVGYGIARMFEELMRDASIYVRAFQNRAAAAQWLAVPVEILEPWEE